MALTLFDAALWGLAVMGAATLVCWIGLLVWFVLVTQAIGAADEEHAKECADEA